MATPTITPTSPRGFVLVTGGSGYIAGYCIASPSCRRKGRSLSLAALIERPRCVGVLERVEHVDRLLIAVGLGEPEGIFGEFGIKQNAAVSL
jgi:hypothetical protein